MRSGGVVGTVQEKVSCNRNPVPTRYPQPLSQGLSALPAPLTQGSQALRGTGFSPSVACGDSSLVRGSQALRGGQGIGAAETPGIKAAGSERNQRIGSRAQAVLPAAF